MPVKIERELEKEYSKKGLQGRRLSNAVYGTLTNIEKRQGKDVHGNPLPKGKPANGH